MTDAPRSLVERLRVHIEDLDRAAKARQSIQGLENIETVKLTLSDSLTSIAALEQEVAELKGCLLEWQQGAIKANGIAITQIADARAQVREQAAKVLDEQAAALKRLAVRYREIGRHMDTEVDKAEARAEELTIAAAAIRAMPLEGGE